MTFIFINTSNVYYDKVEGKYWYFENHAYDVHNESLNSQPLLLKLSLGNINDEKYQQLFTLMLELKKRT